MGIMGEKIVGVNFMDDTQYLNLRPTLSDCKTINTMLHVHEAQLTMINH